MPYYRKARTPSKKNKRIPSKRRRLQPGVMAPLILAAGAKLVKTGINKYSKAKIQSQTYKARQEKSSINNRLENSDNIINSKLVTIGTKRKDSFQEKVSKATRPPLLFRRTYGFNAESNVSGRKAMFSMMVNLMTSYDLQQDISSYKANFTTDNNADGQIAANSEQDGAYYYIDSHREKIRMINSSTLPLTGKVHLFAYKRDSGQTYGNSAAIVDPVNMLMYYSSISPAPVTADVGGGQTIGRGFEFSTAAPDTTNYAVAHNMPGSSINTAGVAAIMDPSLSFTQSHVKDGINFWFKKISSQDLSLKPGQQINLNYLFSDLPNANREEQAQYVYVAGLTYAIVVEFQGGIVGDSTPTTGDGVVSIGSTQLSVYRESSRVIGLKNYLRSKIMLQTVPIANIAAAAQVTVNPDTSAVDIGTAFDT